MYNSTLFLLSLAQVVTGGPGHILCLVSKELGRPLLSVEAKPLDSFYKALTSE